MEYFGIFTALAMGILGLALVICWIVLPFKLWSACDAIHKLQRDHDELARAQATELYNLNKQLSEFLSRVQ